MDNKLPTVNKQLQIMLSAFPILHQIQFMKNVWALLALGLLAFEGQAQNVGIGITAPTYPLTVQGTSLGKGVTVKNGALEVGLFNNGTVAFLQTWSEHDLHLGTGNGGAKISLSYATGNVGINTPDPTAQLDINGTLRLRNNGAAAGKILTSDATGNATWSGSVAFSAQGGYQNNFVNNGTTVILYNTELFDNGGNYNPAIGAFTAPVAGVYHFDATTRLTTGIAPDLSRYQLFVNGVAQRASDPNTGFMELSANINLNAGDVVDVRYFYNDNSGATITVSTVVLFNNFSGFLIR